MGDLNAKATTNFRTRGNGRHGKKRIYCKIYLVQFERSETFNLPVLPEHLQRVLPYSAGVSLPLSAGAALGPTRIFAGIARYALSILSFTVSPFFVI